MYDNSTVYAAELTKKYKIPAVAIAVWQHGKLYTGCAGVANLNTGVPVTSDTLFQIGSITKVMTACLVMQLVEEGKVKLDTPVKHYLPDFRVADKAATESITVRQLLTHTSGMEGDFFPDDHGQTGNLIARYVDRCSLLPQLFAPGKAFAYSNAAFTIAGRLVEVMRNLSWHEVINRYVFTPLGMHHATANPAELLRFRTAMGHLPGDDKEAPWKVADRPYLTLGQAPAGITPTMTAIDLITFARVFMEDNSDNANNGLLSPAGIQAMQVPQCELKDISHHLRRYIAMAWVRTDYPEHDFYTLGHTGGTNGFISNLVVFPQHNAAFAVLMNCLDNYAMGVITQKLFTDIVDITLKKEPQPAGNTSPEFLKTFEGQYACMDRDAVVKLKGNEQGETTLTMTVTYHLDPIPPAIFTLRHDRNNSFVSYNEKGARSGMVSFPDRTASGMARSVLIGSRLAVRQCTVSFCEEKDKQVLNVLNNKAVKQ